MSERAVWETPDGRRLYSAETSHHHVLSERKWYTTPLQKKFRAMGGLVLHLANQPHRELHANVAAPPLINPNLMQDIYLHSRRRDYEDEYSLFHQIADYVAGVAVSFQCDQNVHDANLLYQNLVEQAAYIEIGRLAIVREAA